MPWGDRNFAVDPSCASRSSIFCIPREPRRRTLPQGLENYIGERTAVNSKAMLRPSLYRLGMLVRDPEIEMDFLVSGTTLELQGR